MRYPPESRRAGSRFLDGRPGSSRPTVLTSASAFDPLYWTRTLTYLADRLVPFVLVLVTLEELIPLLVLYAPFMLPSTCILPSQRERVLSKRRQSVAVYAASMKEDFQKIAERASPQVPSSLISLSRTELLAVCG